jgi:hypothetical protein
MVARSKEKRGLGVGNLIERYIGKRLWRYHRELDTVWSD